jgi:hypothetical protein
VTFTHPAARGAKVWTAKLKSGETKSLLIVMTNAELNRDKKRYNAAVVDGLISAIDEYLRENGGIDGYVLSNRMRDWENARDS